MVPSGQLASLLAVIDSATPSFTLFELADGHRLLAPPVDGVAAFLVLTGTMALDDGRGTTAVPAGQMVLLPAGRRAAISPDGLAAEASVTTVDGKASLLHRDGWQVADATAGQPAALVIAAARIAGSGADALAAPVVAAVADTPAGKPMLALIRAECARGAKGHPAFAMSLMSACVVHALGCAIELAREDGTESDADAHGLIGRAVAAVRARPGAPHTVNALADAAGMSRSTFLRHFRRLMRMSPIEFVQRVRLEEARTMLGGTTLPIKAVAARTGFASRSHFSRLFRATFGHDPSSFRQQQDRVGPDA